MQDLKKVEKKLFLTNCNE